MAGPNYGLSKGFLATGGSVAYKRGECAVLTGNNTVARATSAGANVLGVVEFNLDADEVATGKATASVQIQGIARCIAGAAVSRGAKVTNDTSARVVTAGAAGTPALGVALTPASQAGDLINVLLTPFNTV